jgi:ComF family protein
MLLQLVKDVLFPVYCVGCEKEGEWCCSDCLKQITPRVTQECPVCYRENNGEACVGCKTPFGLDGILAFYVYKDTSPLGELIKQLKYTHARETIQIFKILIEQAYTICLPLFKNSAIGIPVPLHEKRRRERGFNQAEFLGKIIRKVLSNKFDAATELILDTSSLVRQRYTEQQARLSHYKRMENLENAFKWKGGAVPKSVILIDDVFTTGSTLQAASEGLKKMGVESVWGLTLARGKMS